MLKTTTETSQIPNPKSRSAKHFLAQLSQKIVQKKTVVLKSCINRKTKNKWKRNSKRRDFSTAPIFRNSKTFTKSNQVSVESCYENCEDYDDCISINP